MAPPTPLAIATSSLTRLQKELSTYHTELSTQQTQLTTKQARLAADGDSDNLAYEVKQEERAVEETRRMLGVMGSKVEDARRKLEAQLVSRRDGMRRDGCAVETDVLM